jgi:putative virulence related protein PagC
VDFYNKDDIMKKLCLALLACTTLGTTFNTLADSNHTVSMGYAQSKIETGPTLKGVNAKYRYEWDSPISIITSLTYMGKSVDGMYWDEISAGKANLDFKYWSFSAGPAYRFNEFISIYSLVGYNANSLKVTSNTQRYSDGSSRHVSPTVKGNAFMYGAGVLINPMNNLSLELGYEGSSLKYDEYTQKRLAINGFNVGVGYRF